MFTHEIFHHHMMCEGNLENLSHNNLVRDLTSTYLIDSFYKIRSKLLRLFPLPESCVIAEALFTNDYETRQKIGALIHMLLLNADMQTKICIFKVGTILTGQSRESHVVWVP